MRFTIINVANKMPSWVVDACSDYLKRINHGKYSCKIIEIKSKKSTNQTSLVNMQEEAKRITEHIMPSSFVIVLDERGKDLSSIQLANFLNEVSLNNSDITLIIGGADGVHPHLKNSAHAILKLSSLTYPHALVRIIILEQLYRAITILEKHPYHRE